LVAADFVELALLVVSDDPPQAASTAAVAAALATTRSPATPRARLLCFRSALVNSGLKGALLFVNTSLFIQIIHIVGNEVG
jgi:hypothetical protein